MFKLKAPFKPSGDQPQAIKALVDGIKKGKKFQTLLGVTGSGKTFTIANVIAQVNKPTIVISHNKTLAAQLYGEFKQFFPENAVEFFISYYDYYQPEAYVPEIDLYIEKDASINEEIDQLRLRATASLLERRDVIIVASVSCIYNLGEPEEYKNQIFPIEVHKHLSRDEVIEKLVYLQYTRNDLELKRACFRVRGDIIEIHPSHRDYGVRLEFNVNELERITVFDLLTNHTIERRDKIIIYPAKYFVTSASNIERAIKSIEAELANRLAELKAQNKLIEMQRLKTRTQFDIEMLREFGYCPGIENYSRHLSGRPPGVRPYCLLDYFPKDYLMVIDESHQTIPQIIGMYNGDRSRKEVLVEYGFRLPSALDNRPLKFEEFYSLINQCIFTSATPTDYEIQLSGNEVVEQIVRPTGLVDPEMIVRPAKNQIDDLIKEIKNCVNKKERVIITTLTKRMAEDLAEYLTEIGFKVKYLHSEINAIERVEILRELRLGEFDILVGINLLREGLDLPEVALVAILDADKEGFLRDERSIIQIAGRAARNVSGRVILYADNITKSIKSALQEAARRRNKQLAYNKKHNIIPQTVRKSVDQVIMTTIVADTKPQTINQEFPDITKELTPHEKATLLKKLKEEMNKAAETLDFERAAQIRDQIKKLKQNITDGEVLKITRKPKQ
ncbi:MAG: excinuclease ABC subunit UvrB [candidate division WOR-3 bacterium]|nr:excinuclease ABC subunit UvrB [candidate division WOR-3 bacterium]